MKGVTIMGMKKINPPRSFSRCLLDKAVSELMVSGCRAVARELNRWARLLREEAERLQAGLPPTIRLESF